MSTVPTSPGPKVCLYRDQIHSYESLWSIFHKFSRWNIAGALDIWHLFGDQNEGQPSEPQHVMRHCDLRDGSGLDQSKLTALFGLSEDSVKNALVSRYSLLDVTTADLGGPWLRFCPQCLCSGYHSPIHQLPFVASCPVHSERLVDVCPACGEKIPYALPVLNTGAPYACQCGRDLWSDLTSSSDDATVRELTDVVAWIDAAAKDRSCLAPALVLHRKHRKYLAGDNSMLAYRVWDMSPTLARPPPAFGMMPTLNDHQIRQSLYSDDTVGDCPGAMLAIYKAILRWLRRLVSEAAPAKKRHERFSCEQWLVADANPSRIALSAWRIYWEGGDGGRHSSPATLSSGLWRNHFLRTYGATFSADSGLPEFEQPASKFWRLQHAVALGCIGTFVECLERACAYGSTYRASELAAEVTGRLVPLCVYQSDLKLQAVHFWGDGDVAALIRRGKLEQANSAYTDP